MHFVRPIRLGLRTPLCLYERSAHSHHRFDVVREPCKVSVADLDAAKGYFNLAANESEPDKQLALATMALAAAQIIDGGHAGTDWDAVYRAARRRALVPVVGPAIALVAAVLTLLAL